MATDGRPARTGGEPSKGVEKRISDRRARLSATAKPRRRLTAAAAAYDDFACDLGRVEAGQFQGFAPNPTRGDGRAPRAVHGRPEGESAEPPAVGARLDKQHESGTAGPGPADRLATEGTVYNGAHGRRCAPSAEMLTWLPPPPPRPSSLLFPSLAFSSPPRPPITTLLHLRRIASEFTISSITHYHPKYSATASLAFHLSADDEDEGDYVIAPDDNATDKNCTYRTNATVAFTQPQPPFFLSTGYIYAVLLVRSTTMELRLQEVCFIPIILFTHFLHSFSEGPLVVLGWR